MATTFTSAVENAARLLRNRENGLRNTYGNANSDAIPLAIAWTDLARVISSVTPTENGENTHE